MGLNLHLTQRASATALAVALLAATTTTTPAATLTVTDISVAAEGGFSVEVPTVEATDANVDEAAIRGLFSGDAAAADLAELDAARIHVPEITLTSEFRGPEGETQRTVFVYRDLELLDVVDGVAASSSVGGAELQGPEGAVLTLGRMSTDLLDIGAMLGFYGFGETASESGDAMIPLYRDFILEGGTFASPGVECEIGTATLAEFRARPLEGTFAAMMETAAALEAAEEAGDPPPPEALADFVAYYADLLTAFESTPAELDGLSCSGEDDSGEAFNFAAGPFVMDGFEPGVYPEFSVDGIRLDTASKGWMELDNFTWKRVDYSGPLAVLAEAGDSLDEAWFTANWRRLVPEIEGFSMRGFDIDIVDPERPGERIVASLDLFDATLGAYVNGVPSAFSTTLDSFAFELPHNADTADLVALGIERLDLSAELAAHWDEASETIVVENVMVGATDLGSVSVSGALANATPNLFSANPDLAALALTRLTATDLRIEFENSGILPVLVALAAAEEDQSPEALHAALVGMGTAMPIALLGASPDSISVGTAVAAFLSGTPNLTLTVTSKDPAGIGLADLMAAEDDPSVLAGKIVVTATTSGEPQALEFPELPPKSESDDTGSGALKNGAE